MSTDKIAMYFEKMDFFPAVDEEETVVYCYEPEEGQEYLIATDDSGGEPRESIGLLVACYSASDSFLWKMEVETVEQLYTIYQNNNDGDDFIARLKNFAK